MKKTQFCIKGGRSIWTLKNGVTIEQYKEKYPERVIRIVHKPSIKTLEKWIVDGVSHSVDGCKVEPDGTCEHGWASWLLILGYI